MSNGATPAGAGGVNPAVGHANACGGSGAVGGASVKCKKIPHVGPVFRQKSPYVLVKKPYTSNPPRQPVTITTDSAFDGTGTLTRSDPGIKFFTALTAGTEITFNGVDNAFAGASLTAGITLYAEGATPTTYQGEVLTLTLTGGSKPVKPPVTTTMTALEVTLDICMSRSARGADPTPLSVADKTAKGRYVHEQDPGRQQGRAKLIVRQANPKEFPGTLVLQPLDAKVALFNDEIPKSGQKALTTPVNIANPSMKKNPKVFWVEGKTVSGGLADTGFKLGVKGLHDEGDKVVATVVRFSNLSATVQSTPPNTPRAAPAANGPVPDHTAFAVGAGAALGAPECDESFTKNLPLVLIEDSVIAGKPVKLSVAVAPPAVPVLWSIQRHVLPGKGDDGSIVALSPKATPTIKQTVGKPLEATMLADAVGSFHVRPYVDCDGSGTFEHNTPKSERIDREPFILMNLVLVRVEAFDNTTSRATDANVKFTPAAPTSATGVRVSTGPPSPWAPATPAQRRKHACYNNAVVTVIGGGADGRLGFNARHNRVFAGWVNQELTSPGSTTAPPGEDVVSTYVDTAVAPPATHQRLSIWDTAAPGTTYGPGGGAPAGISGPLLDTVLFGAEGTGGDRCVGTALPGPGPPVKINKTNLKIGQRWRVEMWDSPGDNCPAAHGFFPGVLRSYRFNIDFRSDLCFWTNVTEVPGASGDAACRLYSTVITNTWTIRIAFTFHPVTGAGVNTVKSISMVNDRNPTRRAAPAEGSGVEVRFPVSLNLLATDART